MRLVPAVLPAPVDTLIIQADHTIMAPGLLSADDAAMLARIADQESAQQLAALERVASESKPLTKERTEGLARVVRQYLKNSQADAPVHTWTLEVE